MTATHNRRVKLVEFEINSIPFQCQLQSWTLNNNTPDGDKLYSLCPDGEFREEVDADYTLSLTFFSDWRSGGVSDYFVLHDGETATFRIDHLPDIAGEHIRWEGDVVLKAPSVGGEPRQTETFEQTLVVIGKPTYSRP